MASDSCIYKVNFIGENAAQFSVAPHQYVIDMENSGPVTLVIFFNASHIANATGD